jgi:hypothetical protein
MERLSGSNFGIVGCARRRAPDLERSQRCPLCWGRFFCGLAVSKQASLTRILMAAADSRTHITIVPLSPHGTIPRRPRLTPCAGAVSFDARRLANLAEPYFYHE